MKVLSTLSMILLLLAGGQSPAPRQEPPKQDEPAKGKKKAKGEKPSFPGLQPGPRLRRQAPDLLPGVWRLQGITGQPLTARMRGYLVLTRLYASFHILVQVRGDRSTFQSGLWRYRRRGDQLSFTRILETGRHPGADSQRRSQGPQPPLRRRIKLAGNRLQLIRPNGIILNFTRLE